VWKASTGKKVTSIQVLKKGAISVTASMITAHHMVLVGDGEGTVSGYTSETFGEKSVVPKFSFKTSDALQVGEGGGGARMITARVCEVWGFANGKRTAGSSSVRFLKSHSRESCLW